MMARARSSISIATFALTMSIGVPPAYGQQWTVEAQAGRIRSELDPAASPSNRLSVGLRYDNMLSAFRVSAGVPTSSSDPYWAAFGGTTRLAARRVRFMGGLDLAGHGFYLRDRLERTRQIPGLLGTSAQRLPGADGYAAAIQALPIIGFESARFQAHARAGVSHYASEFSEQTRSRTARIADLQLTVAPTTRIAAITTIRQVAAASADHMFAGFTGIVDHGKGSLWGTVGHWTGADTMAALSWAAGATIRLHTHASLSASARRDSFDPLFFTLPQTSWQAGIAWHIGARPSTGAPVPAAYSHGRATIRLAPASVAKQPRIAGDFNGWQPQPMERTGNAWTFTTTLGAGVYNYAFVDDQGEWFVPEHQPGRKPDGMGGYVAVLVVPK